MLSKTFNVLDILWYPVSIIGVNMIGPRTAFKIEVLQTAGKRYFAFGLCT